MRNSALGRLLGAVAFLIAVGVVVFRGCQPDEAGGGSEAGGGEPAGAEGSGDTTGAASGPADLVLTGGLVWAGAGSPISGAGMSTALAVADGRVTAVGTDAEVEAMPGPGTRRIDLAGRRVVPGFMDDHTHFTSRGTARARGALTGAGPRLPPGERRSRRRS